MAQNYKAKPIYLSIVQINFKKFTICCLIKIELNLFQEFFLKSSLTRFLVYFLLLSHDIKSSVKRYIELVSPDKVQNYNT